MHPWHSSSAAASANRPIGYARSAQLFGLDRAHQERRSRLALPRPNYSRLKLGMFFTVALVINLCRLDVNVLSSRRAALSRNRSLSAESKYSVGATSASLNVAMLQRTDDTLLRRWRR